MKRFLCNDGSEKLPYVIRVPSEMKSKLPLVISLHGTALCGDGSDEQLDRVEGYGFAEILPLDKEIDCILISPQIPVNSVWPCYARILGEFVKDMIKKYDVDEDRVYLTGVSLGAYGAWYMAIQFPNLFAAIAPVAGGGIPAYAPWIKTPVWAFHGGKDEAVDVSNSIDMIEAMRKVAIVDDIRLDIIPDMGHCAELYAYCDDKLLKWFLSHKLNRA